jgi:hypothetical protein
MLYGHLPVVINDTKGQWQIMKRDIREGDTQRTNRGSSTDEKGGIADKTPY